MKKLSFLVAALCATTMAVNAESFTIKFKTNGTTSDGQTQITQSIDSLVNEGADYLSALKGEYIYLAKGNYGIKGSTSSKKGILTLTLKQEYAITSIVANVASFNNKEDKKKTILINEKEITFSAETDTLLHDVTVTLDGAKTNEIVIAAKTNNKNRWYCSSLTINYTDAPTALVAPEIADIYANGGTIEGIGAAGRIFTVSGMEVTSQNGALTSGIYIVKLGDKTQKIAVK